VRFNAWQYDQDEVLWAALALKILAEDRNIFSLGRVKLLWSRLNWEKIVADTLKLFVNLIIAVVVAGVLGYLAIEFVLAQGQGDNFTFLVTLVTLTIRFTQAAPFLTPLIVVLIFGSKLFGDFVKPSTLTLTQFLNKPSYESKTGFIEEFKRDFERIIKSITNNGRRPLLIFIDDLDRCVPGSAAEIMQAINLIIDFDDIVYVLGMDSQVVASAIETTYQDLKTLVDAEVEAGGLTLGERFLEKIVQIHFHIPQTSSEAARAFLTGFLEASAGLGDAKKRQPDARARIDQSAEDKGVKHAQAVRRVEAIRREMETFDQREDVRKSLAEAAAYLEYNPRKLKRFLNHYRLKAAICQERELINDGVIDLATLSKWVVMETRWPDFIAILRDTPGFGKQLVEVHDKLQDVIQQQEKEVAKQKKSADLLRKELELKRELENARAARFIRAESLLKLLRTPDLAAIIHQKHRVQTYLHLIEIPEQEPLPSQQSSAPPELRPSPDSSSQVPGIAALPIQAQAS
jgi:hypothetical protein